MKQVNLTITFDEEKLSALKRYDAEIAYCCRGSQR